MPFVMAPVLWSRLSGGFRKDARLSERAHGDGMLVGYDSPEAFEEIVWRAFWPDHYLENGLRPWTAADRNGEVAEFMRRHFRKIVALRRGTGSGRGRYLSKNNANIARIDLIRAMFPDAAIVVPLRHPMAQAYSLRRQHANFLQMHARDPFVRRYMGDIGHYEFGELHRPILFDGFAELREGLTPGELDYWLAYWIAGFEHVRARRSEVFVTGFERFSAGGSDSAGEICRAVGVDPALAPRLTTGLRPAPPLAEEASAHRSPLRDRAEALADELSAPQS